VPIGTGVDGYAFDDATQLAFASCGDGTTTIAKEETPQALTTIQTLKTERGAHTIGLDPQTASDLFTHTRPGSKPGASTCSGQSSAGLEMHRALAKAAGEIAPRFNSPTTRRWRRVEKRFMATPAAINAVPDQSENRFRRHRSAVSSEVDLCQDEAKTRHHETEGHQSKAGANPREERSLFGEMIPHVSPWLTSDARFHSRLLTPKHSRDH
jgi:hypothetical protein